MRCCSEAMTPQAWPLRRKHSGLTMGSHPQAGTEATRPRRGRPTQEHGATPEITAPSEAAPSSAPGRHRAACSQHPPDQGQPGPEYPVGEPELGGLKRLLQGQPVAEEPTRPQQTASSQKKVLRAVPARGPSCWWQRGTCLPGERILLDQDFSGPRDRPII